MNSPQHDTTKGIILNTFTRNVTLSPAIRLQEVNAVHFPSAVATCSLRVAAILFSLAGMSAASAQSAYSVTDLGVLPGCVTSGAANLNDRGEVVGHCASDATSFTYTAFVWRNGTMSAVGKLVGGNYSEATAINSAGKIAGTGDTGNMRPQAWVTSANGLVNISPNNGGNTRTSFIADNGFIGGYYTKSSSGSTSSWKGAIWTSDAKDPRKYRTTILPILAGGIDPNFSSALPVAFNQSGQAAGYAQNDQIGHHAAFWNNDATHSIVDLGVFESDWGSIAYGISDVGQIVGVSHPPFASRPILWSSDAAHTPFALPVLAGDNCGSANAINNVGQVVGFSYACTPGSWDSSAPRVTVWRDNGVFDLQSLLDTSGAGWHIVDARAINNVGQIAATGMRNGETRALLLTPSAQ
jgi:probable HAF family extracellular repeat protein